MPDWLWRRDMRCRETNTYGHNEYDAHSHRCKRPRGHEGDHDFSFCPEGRHVMHPPNLAAIDRVIRIQVGLDVAYKAVDDKAGMHGQRLLGDLMTAVDAVASRHGYKINRYDENGNASEDHADIRIRYG